MAGTKAGGQKAAATNKARHGPLKQCYSPKSVAHLQEEERERGRGNCGRFRVK